MMLLIVGIVIGQLSSVVLFWACIELAKRDVAQQPYRPPVQS